MTKIKSIFLILSILSGISLGFNSVIIGEAATTVSNKPTNSAPNASKLNGSPVNASKPINTAKPTNKTPIKNNSNINANIACTPASQSQVASTNIATGSNATPKNKTPNKNGNLAPKSKNSNVTTINSIPDASVTTNSYTDEKPVFKFMSAEDGVPDASGNVSSPVVNTSKPTNTNSKASNITPNKKINNSTLNNLNNSNTKNNSVSSFSSWLNSWRKSTPINTNKNLKNTASKLTTNSNNKALCITTNGKSSVYANANSSINPYKDRMKANCTYANVKLDGEGSNQYPMTGAEPPMTLSLIASRGVSVSNTNCYGYAVNSWGNVQDAIRKGLSTNSDGSYKPQPGAGNAFDIMNNFSWATVNSGVIKDGLKPVGANAKCPQNHYKIFGYMTNANSSDVDYHWILQNRPGMDGKVRFSHKPGNTAATDRDAKGKVINGTDNNPLTPGLLHYAQLKYDFTQAYCVPCNLWIDPVNMATILKKPPTRK